MSFQHGATKVSIPPSNVEFPGAILKARNSYGFGFRPTKGAHTNHLGGEYWVNRVPFIDSQRLAAASASKDRAKRIGGDLDFRHRRTEPVTPQNSALSDGYLSGRGFDSIQDETFQNDYSAVKPVQKTKRVKEPKPSNSVPQLDENETQYEPSFERVDSIPCRSPQRTPELSETFIDKAKTPNQLNIRELRWSTTAINDVPKQTKLEDAPTAAASRKIGPKSKNLCVRSEFTFSTYDFYNKHNKGTWFGTTVSRRDRKPTTAEEATKFEELRNYRKIFSHGRIEELVKDWAQEAYKARAVQMLFPEVERDDYRENESVAPLLTHMKKQSSADSLPSIMSSMRKSSITPRQGRRSSLFFALPSFEHLSEQERIDKRQIRNFRWYSHLIRAMVRLSANMRQLSRELTQKSAYSEFLYILAGARTHAGQEGLSSEAGGGKSGEPQLLFDKSWFSRGRARSRMPPWAIEVMSRPPDKRSPQQVLHLKHLLATMKSFRENMTEDMRTKMCQVVRYTKCDKGRVVLRQGHLGHDFYFIFSGSVFIQIDIYDPVQDEMKTSVENVLRMGEGFGEIALLGDGHRTASVICKEPTELCQIDKATFLEVCPALFNQLLEDKVQFARQFPLFSSWDPEDLRKLCFLSQVLDVPHSTVIEANWARPDFAYFVMKGRVSMLKEFDVTDIEENARATRGVQDETEEVQQPTDTEESNTKKRHTMFANVGTLAAGTHTELSVLSVEPPKDIPPIALVSEGARLLRITVRVFRRIAPRKLCEEYLRKTYKRRTFPSEDDLRSLYLADKSWSAFKTTILQTQLLGQSGALLATVPATLKGSSGWSRWPGYAVRKTKHKPSREFPLFNHEEYARQAEALQRNEFRLDGIFDDDDYDDDEEDDAGTVATDEIGYFYDSESSEDPLLRTPISTPLDDSLENMRPDSDRSNTQDPPKCGPVSSWRRRLSPN